VVDTTRVRQLGIGQHKRKNDRIDAEVLARFGGAFDLIHSRRCNGSTLRVAWMAS
jgi:hypothetical protein